MRVIAGSARHLNLKTVPGMDVRPTTDKTKETLFNVLNADVPYSKFLDLFSGSGAIGIEALSRGADKCIFVEKSRNALSCIKNNLDFTKLGDNAVILPMDVIAAIKSLESNGEVFDIVFMDPPYNKELEKSVLEVLSSSSLINNDSIIIVESSNETDLSYIGNLGMHIYKEKVYKTNKHTFICKDN